MPRINLLPVKAQRRLDQAKKELFALVGLFAFILFSLGLWYAATANEIKAATERKDALAIEIDAINQAVQKVDEFKKKAATLEQKLLVIEQLRRKRIGPGHMLGEIADILTQQKHVWLTRLQQENGTLRLEGAAMQQEDISSFQLALAQQSKRFQNVTLSLVNSAKAGTLTYFEWAMTCQPDDGAG